MTASPKYPEVEKLTAELFKLIERSQGYAYFSDGETFPTTEQFFERTAGRLKHARKTVEIYEAFLKKHGHLPAPPPAVPSEQEMREILNKLWADQEFGDSYYCRALAAMHELARRMVKP